MSLSKYTPAQLQIARDTLTIAHGLGVPIGSKIEQALICVQIVESSLRGPIWFGDNPVTKGAYQQKDDWVPKAVLNDWMDPRRTLAGGTYMFLYGGAAGQKGYYAASAWWTGTIGQSIQAVQQSGVPTAYDKAAPDAAAILQAVR